DRVADDAARRSEGGFVVRKEDYVDGDRAFVQAVNAELALRPPGKRRVVLFVHGFNTMFAEGLYRLAQLIHGGPAIAYDTATDNPLLNNSGWPGTQIYGKAWM